ncbi:hypothetical protein [Stenotrophomonas forensis]|uniref:hypothetical protein n=1 Tax=Stenotrophomonas forensis TaxID=2871169 RepID=UPI0039C68467
MSVRANHYTAGTLPSGWLPILPCPFCNGPGRLTVSFCVFNKEQATCAFVDCPRCGAAGGTVERADLPEDGIARHALRKWNRRGTHQNANWKLQRIAQVLGSDYVETAQ